MIKHTAESLQKAFRYLFPDEVPALKELARSLPDNPIVVNIGAGSGTSGLAFMESREDLRLVTIDIQEEASPFGSLDAEKAVLQEAKLWSHREVYQLCSDSKTIGGNWPISMCNSFFGVITLWNEFLSQMKRVNMVFIDGDHSYEGCKGDIEAWLPNIKPGGIIAVHDYKKSELYAHDKDYQPDKPHPKPWPGIDRAVDELLMGEHELIMRVDSLVAFRV